MDTHSFPEKKGELRKERRRRRLLCVGWFLELATLNLRYKRKKREVFFLETASSSIFEEKHAMVGTKDHWYFSSSSAAKATPKAKSSVMNHQSIFYLRRESTQVKVVARVVAVVYAVTAVFTVAGAVVAASAVVAAVFVVVAVIVVVGVAVVVVVVVVVVVAVIVVDVAAVVAVVAAAAALAVDDGAVAVTVAVATAFVFVVVATTTAAKVLLEILSRYQGTQPNVCFGILFQRPSSIFATASSPSSHFLGTASPLPSAHDCASPTPMHLFRFFGTGQRTVYAAAAEP